MRSMFLAVVMIIASCSGWARLAKYDEFKEEPCFYKHEYELEVGEVVLGATRY